MKFFHLFIVLNYFSKMIAVIKKQNVIISNQTVNLSVKHYNEYTQFLETFRTYRTRLVNTYMTYIEPYATSINKLYFMTVKKRNRKMPNNIISSNRCNKFFDISLSFILNTNFLFCLILFVIYIQVSRSIFNCDCRERFPCLMSFFILAKVYRRFCSLKSTDSGETKLTFLR